MPLGAGAGAVWGKNQEPERKMSGDRAEAAQKFAGSPALLVQRKKSIRGRFIMNVFTKVVSPK